MLSSALLKETTESVTLREVPYGDRPLRKEALRKRVRRSCLSGYFFLETSVVRLRC
jgi:hypothetical protein